MSAPPRAAGAAVVALMCLGACGSSYEARRAPLGTPSIPPARAEGLTTWESWEPAGLYTRGKAHGLAAIVDRDGRFEVLYSEGVVVEGGVRWDVRLDGGEGVGVNGLFWAPASSSPCRGGQRGKAILLDRPGPAGGRLEDDRDVHWERPVVVRGPRVVSGRFDDAPELRLAPSFIDLELAPRAPGDAMTCVRAPIVGPEVTYWNRTRWSMGLRLSYRRALRFSPSSTVSVGLSLGRWLGPVRVAVEGVAGGTDEDHPLGSSRAGTALCFAAGGPACDTVNFGGFALEAGGFAGRLSPTWVVGWSASIETLWASVVTFDAATSAYPSRSAAAAGPRVALQLLRASHPLAGVSPRSPADAWGLELFVSAPRELSGAALGSRVSFGLSLLTF